MDKYRIEIEFKKFKITFLCFQDNVIWDLSRGLCCAYLPSGMIKSVLWGISKQPLSEFPLH